MAEVSPGGGNSQINDLMRNMDASQLMAIQELMTDMSPEERTKFME